MSHIPASFSKSLRFQSSKRIYVPEYLLIWEQIRDQSFSEYHAYIACTVAKFLVSRESFELFQRFVNCIRPEHLFRLMDIEEFRRALISLKMNTGDYHGVCDLLKVHTYKCTDGLLDIWDMAHYRMKEGAIGRPLTTLMKFRVRQRNPPPKTICPTGKRPTPKLPVRARSVLQRWLQAHLCCPYPSREEKNQLSTKSGLSLPQVKTWFANARRRMKARLKAKKNSRSAGSCTTCRKAQSVLQEKLVPSAKCPITVSSLNPHQVSSNANTSSSTKVVSLPVSAPSATLKTICKNIVSPAVCSRPCTPQSLMRCSNDKGGQSGVNVSSLSVLPLRHPHGIYHPAGTMKENVPQLQVQQVPLVLTPSPSHRRPVCMNSPWGTSTLYDFTRTCTEDTPQNAHPVSTRSDFDWPCLSPEVPSFSSLLQSPSLYSPLYNLEQQFLSPGATLHGHVPWNADEATYPLTDEENPFPLNLVKSPHKFSCLQCCSATETTQTLPQSSGLKDYGHEVEAIQGLLDLSNIGHC